MTRFAVVHLDELPRIPSDSREDPAWTPVRHPLGIGAFGVNAWHGEQAGDVVIEDHDEIPANSGAGGHEELYVVLRGQARFTVDGEDVVAGPGTLLAVPPHLRRTAVAARDDTVVLCIGAARGEAFTPSPWELRALAKAGLVS